MDVETEQPADGLAPVVPRRAQVEAPVAGRKVDFQVGFDGRRDTLRRVALARAAERPGSLLVRWDLHLDPDEGRLAGGHQQTGGLRGLRIGVALRGAADLRAPAEGVRRPLLRAGGAGVASGETNR